MTTDFGQTLKEFRLASGQTVSQLATGAGVGQSNLSRWERGYAVPSAIEIENLGSVLALSRPQIDYLLSISGYAPKDTTIIEPTIALAPEGQGIRELRVQVSDLKNLVEGVLRSRSGERSGGVAGDGAQLEELALLASEIQASSQRITAPIVLPTSDELKVRLVAAPQVERLEEYRAESKIWSTAFGISFGLASGVLVNVATGSEIGAEMWALCGLLLVVSLVFLFASFRKSRSASSIAKTMMD